MLPLPIYLGVFFNIIYLAAVILKQFIKKHWHEDDDNFEPPIVANDEKVTLILYFSVSGIIYAICA